MYRNPELVGLVLVIASGLVLGWWDKIAMRRGRR